MRVADETDHLEDLYLAIRVLREEFGKSPATIRRWVNQTLRGVTPASIRDRVLPNHEEAS